VRRTKNYTPAEKEQLLKEVKQTGNLSLVGKKHNVPVSTLHSWLGKAKHVPSEKKSPILRRLKKELADKELEIQVLKELLKKTNQVWLGD
jgi:transposase-like protein